MFLPRSIISNKYPLDIITGALLRSAPVGPKQMSIEHYTIKIKKLHVTPGEILYIGEGRKNIMQNGQDALLKTLGLEVREVSKERTVMPALSFGTGKTRGIAFPGIFESMNKLKSEKVTGNPDRNPIYK